MRRTGSLHLLIAAAFAVGLAVLPVERVAACSCMFTELPEAIQVADVAVVGRLVDRSGPAGGGPMGQELAWTWEVERTRDPIDAGRLTVAAPLDDGGNCGVTFGIDERWLLLASQEDGRLSTSGCMRNHPIDGSDPEAEALIAQLVPLTVDASEPPDAVPGIPVPLLVAMGAVLVTGLVGFVVFRRDPR